MGSDDRYETGPGTSSRRSPLAALVALCDVRRVRRATVLLMTVLVLGVGCDSARNEDGYGVQVDLTATIAQLGAEQQVDIDAAVEKLASLGDVAVPALEKAVATEPQPIALAAIEALGQMESPRADAALITVATKHDDEETRATAILKLGEGARPSARPVIEAALGDPSPVVSQTAALACGALCTSPSAIDRLVELGLRGVPDTDFARLRSTLVSLLRIPDQAAATHTRERIRSETATVFGGTTAPDLRARAALLAADAGATDVEPEIAVAATGNNPTLRLTAIQWLGRSGSAVGVPALVEALGKRPTRGAAAIALREAASRGIEGAQAAIASAAYPVAPAPATRQ